MKKIKLLIIIMICLFISNVKADMGAPTVARHKAMITNKSGAACYENGKKTGKVIPYGTTFEITEDIDGSYIYVYSDNYNCNIKYSDISAVSQEFKLDNNNKITPVKAVILAKGGLNMRKGPAVTYGKIMTIPEHAVVTLTHKSGDYWYYCEYNGKTGWITGMNGYFGYEGKEVLVNYQDIKIYSTVDRKAVVGKIPANTEITDYIELVSRMGNDYYVIYNGTRGYIDTMLYKTDGTGKIKLIKDYSVTEEYTGKLIKKFTANQELEYNMSNGESRFYFPDKKMEVYIPKEYYEYVKEAKPLIKKSGYIGEGLFGEAKEERKEEIVEPNKEENKKEEQTPDNKQSNSISTKELIIICLLAGIFLALTALVIIKLVNRKKKVSNTNLVEQKKTDLKPEVNSINNEIEIEKAREIIEKRMQSELNNQTNDENKEV